MPMRIGTEMPKFDGATEWLGTTQAHAEAEAKGQPTIVHFWSVSCGICKDNLPRIAEWRDMRREQGLRVVAIHMPRYEADTDVEAVRDAVATNGIPNPVPSTTSTSCATHSRTIRDMFRLTICLMRKENFGVLLRVSEDWIC